MNSIDNLAAEYSSKSLEELEKMESAIKLARSMKTDAKRDSIPKDDVERLRAVWKVCEEKRRVDITIVATVEVVSCDGDPCSVYPSVIQPECMRDWDAFELASACDKEAYCKIGNAVEQLQDLLSKANKISREFTEKYDIPAESFL